MILIWAMIGFAGGALAMLLAVALGLQLEIWTRGRWLARVRREEVNARGETHAG